jgi:hypothetical protein
MEHGVDTVVAHAVVCVEHAGHQVREVLWACADELRQRITQMVALADECPVGPEARAHEARVLDEDIVQPDDLVEGERVLPRLEYGAPLSFETVARRTFALNLEARAAVGQQQEADGPRGEMGANAAHGIARAA